MVAVVSCLGVLGCESEPERPTKLRQFHGLTENIVVAKLGEPKSTLTFPMGKGQPEFRVELHRFYPPSNPANHKVLIKELRWRDGDYHMAVWFHKVDGKWVALDSVKWHKSIVF
ncbi:MAG: hypothetical protein ACE5KM_05325 [Planctomycetaceae bacterium]